MTGCTTTGPVGVKSESEQANTAGHKPVQYVNASSPGLEAVALPLV